MKLAAFGLVVGVVGLILGVDGLVFAGGLWLCAGLLVRVLVQRGEDDISVDGAVEAETGRIAVAEDQSTRLDRGPRLGVPGPALLLVTGLGSIAIGVAKVGFAADHESLRWLPIAVGVYITVIGLVSIPVELGMIKPPRDSR